MAGKIGYIGVSLSPIAHFVASSTQQTIPKVKIAGVKYANEIGRNILKRSKTVSCVSPVGDEMRLASIVLFSEVCCPHQSMEK